MKKLQCIPNNMNISVIEYFDSVYIYNGVKIALSTHGSEAFTQLHLLVQVSGVIRALQTPNDGNF